MQSLATRSVPTSRIHGRLRSCLGLVIIFASVFLSARAQQSRWYQMSEQVVQMDQQGKGAEAIPLAQQTVSVAESTFGPNDVHVGLSLNRLGLLLQHQEKFTDAETAFRRALNIFEAAYGQNNSQVAAVAGNLGNLYREAGRYSDAEKYSQQAVMVGEKVLKPDDPGLGVSISNLATLYKDEGKPAQAEPLYRRALAIDQKAPNNGGRELAIDFSNLAVVLDEQAKYAEAEQLYSQVLAIDVKVLGSDRPEVAEDIANFAETYVHEGKYSVAEPMFVRALQIDQKALGQDSSKVAWILAGMATLYSDEGRYNDAAPLLGSALKIQAKALGPDHPEVASTIDSLGVVYNEMGRYGDAETFYRTAINIREKKLGPTHPLLAVSLSNLAGVYQYQGRWGEAEALYRRAMDINLKALGQENPQVAVVLHNMADMNHAEGKFADSERLLRGALAIDEKAYGPNHPATAKDLNSLGDLLEDEGKIADAEQIYQQCLSTAEKALGPNHPNVAVYLANLATVYEREGKYEQAEPLLKRALSIDESVLGTGHPDTGAVQSQLAVLYYSWNKPDLAEPYFDKRLGNLMDQFRSNASYMSERDRLIFLATVPGAFPLYFSFALKYHDHNPALAGKMYDALLQEKGFIADSAAALRAKVLASGDQQTLALLDRLTAEKTALAAIVESSQGDPNDRRKQISQLTGETDQLEQKIVQKSAALAESKTMSTATWRDVQKALKPGEAAVEITRFQFHNGKSFTSTFYYVALVVTPESKNPDFIVLGEGQKLESAPMARYRAVVARTRGISTEPEPGDASANAASGSTSAAYEALWKPLEPALGGVKRVYVSPDGALNQIPIGLLADDSGKLLMEKYQLRYVNSTKDLLRPARAAATKTAILIGNPKFDLTELEERAALAALNGGSQSQAAVVTAAALATQPIKRGADLSGSALNPLPGTQVEVDSIHKLLKDSGWQAELYTGDRALKEVADKMRGPSIVHIATHGFFLTDEEIAQKSKTPGKQTTPEDPMLRSGLFFAGADRVRSGAAPAAGLDDGVLTAFEASQLDLQGTELVVLSACETGLGQQSNSEGVFGLRRGLQEAGSDAVMMSMWSVPDRETQELMALFYAKWLAGQEKPEALRQAQLEEREVVRKRYGKDLPFYWGAFVLVSR